MARFVVDEALPRSLADAMRKSGHEVIHVRDIGMQGASDVAVYDYAQRQEAILVTPDLEFGDIRNFPPGTHCGIVLLRMPKVVTAAWLAKEVARLIGGLGEVDLRGNLVIVEPGHVRIRKASA